MVQVQPAQSQLLIPPERDRDLFRPKGWDAEGNAFQANGWLRKVEGGCRGSIGHFAKCGDFLAGLVGEKLFGGGRNFEAQSWGGEGEPKDLDA